MKIRMWQFDGCLAAMFASYGAWLLWDSQAKAAVAIRQSGHPPVDAGAFVLAGTVLFLLPLAILFGVASVANGCGWRIGRYVHWFALIAALCLVGGVFVDAISR